MAWLCIFLPHRWKHVTGGIYQCSRCKLLSVGHAEERP